MTSSPKSERLQIQVDHWLKMALLIKNPILATVVSSPTVLPHFVARMCQHIVTVKANLYELEKSKPLEAADTITSFVFRVCRHPKDRVPRIQALSQDKE
jgi:hypothetical protein